MTRETPPQAAAGALEALCLRTVLTGAMALPMLIFYAIGTLGPFLVADLGIAPGWLGYLTMSAFGFAALLSLWAGALVNRLGSRRSLVLLALSAALAYGLIAVLPGFVGVVLAVAFCGVAQALSIQVALLIAAAGGGLAALIVARLVALPAGTPDLTPSMHWPEPAQAGPIAGDRGPVLVTITYRIDPADRQAFLRAIQPLARIRRRDGAFGWRVLEDAEDPGRFEEIFHAASGLGHLRQHRRVTLSDVADQERVAGFHRGTEPPVVRHLLGAQPRDHGRPAPIGDHTH